MDKTYRVPPQHSLSLCPLFFHLLHSFTAHPPLGFPPFPHTHSNSNFFNPLPHPFLSFFWSDACQIVLPKFNGKNVLKEGSLEAVVSVNSPTAKRFAKMRSINGLQDCWNYTHLEFPTIRQRVTRC